MTDAASLTFHVPFVPGTVRDLRIFMPSLAAWGGGCQIRLVSNGCSPAEDELLRQLVKLSPRFDFYRLPGRQTWEHGAALSHLQRRETGPRFAFFDSDIFATGDYLRDLCTRAGAVTALFSCPPVWSNDRLQTVPRDFRIAIGDHWQMEDGFCIGSTYFAIYDNRVLSDCLATHGINLCPYPWEDIPAAVRERLVAEGREMIRYDTAKLVNILLNLDGHPCRFLTTQHLHHVGGVSSVRLSRRSNLYGLIRRGWWELVPPVVRRVARWAGLYNGLRERVSSDELLCLSAKVERSRFACEYVYRLLRTLNGSQTRGVDASGDAQLDAQLQRMEAIIRQLFPTWCSWLDGREPIVALGSAVRPPEVGDGDIVAA